MTLRRPIPSNRRQSASGFNPLLLPGGSAAPILFVDFDTGVTLNGGDVVAVADQTGNGNHLAQATGSAQPALVSNWRNGRAAMQGAAGDSLFRAALTGGAIATSSTHVFVLETAATASNTFVGAGAPRRDVFISGSSQYCMFAGAQITQGSAATAGRAGVIVATFAGASSRLDLWQQGLDPITVSGNTGANSFNLPVLGAFNDGTNNFTGKIAAAAVYQGALSAADREYLVHGLCNRYAIVPSSF